jgi:3-methylcrotonyl-CoA carboxylase alpha subunit
MKRYQITVDGRTFDVQVLGDPRQEQVEVEVDGRRLTVEVKASAARDETVLTTPAPSPAPAVTRTPLDAPGAGAASGNRVVAPLPGVIKSIAVRSGQRVAPGDELLVIDAMKMDNVLRASRVGIVETIHIAEGHQIAHGQLLLEYQD